MEMNEYKHQKPIEEDVNHLIALCSILDDYEEFRNNLSKLLLNKNTLNIADNLVRLADGKSIFGKTEVKKFYKNNKKVLDILRKNSSICDFIIINYNAKGELIKNSSLEFFYQYILNNRENLDKILSVLERIKSLGISKIIFDEKKDFTSEKYSLEKGIMQHIKYLENMKAVPKYESDIIEYITTSSNYCLNVYSMLYGQVSRYGHQIILNNLIFDAEKLPKALTKENTFDKIVNLKNEQQKEYTIIKNSVDLSVGVDDLCNQFNIISKTLEKIENIENKENLKKVLESIKKNLEKLQNISSKYDDNISKNNPSITKEQLENEKKLLLKKRFYNGIHID